VVVQDEECLLDIRTCDATFDTELALYDFSCPTTDNVAIACSDDDCGNGSHITATVKGPGLFRIRIGGKDGATGTGTLSISCLTAPPCPWDCAPDNGDGTFGNGVVNVDDLLQVINGFGGNDTRCDNAPDNGDGTFGNGVINIDDLLGVINNLGDCPL